MAEAKDRFEVAGIESKRGFVGLDRSRNVAGTLQSMAKQKTRSALRGEQIDGSTQRRHGRLGIFFRQEDAQIEESLRHFRIQRGGTFVFGASLVGPLEGSVGVAELEVGPGNVGSFYNNLVESSDSGFKLIVVDVVLRFVEEIVERIGDLLSSRLGGLFGGGLREESRRGGRERRDASCPQECCDDHDAEGKGRDNNPMETRHGWAGGFPAPLAIVPEGTEDLDAPLAERFAWPPPLRTRLRKRPVWEC